MSYAGVETVCVVCLVSHHWLPSREGEALRLRPAGSRLGRSLSRSRPLQTSAQAGLTTAPLLPAFMCPLMRKPPAQQPAIKHRRIKTPKYESAKLPNSAGQARGVALLKGDLRKTRSYCLQRPRCKILMEKRP